MPWWLALLVLVLLVPIVLWGAFILGHALNNRPIPSFPSLTASPDTSLHGTVAYFDDASQCVRVTSAAGAPSRDALCLGKPDMSSVKDKGKPMAPQLAWRNGNQLVVTGIRMTGSPGFKPEWQKVVTLPAGTVTDVPASQVPTSVTKPSRPLVSPSGARITVHSDPSVGKVSLTLTEGGTTRTLMSAQGPGEYMYGMNSAGWSPDWKWVLANDGRLLVVTTGAQPTTRILVAHPWTGDDSAYQQYDITGADLLTSGK